MSIKLTLCAPDEVREWGPAAHWHADTSERTPGMLVVWRSGDHGQLVESHSFPLHRVVCCHIQIPERWSPTKTKGARLIECDCSAADTCPQGRVGSERKCRILSKTEGTE